MSQNENKPRALVSADEEKLVGRALLAWLNTCEDKPVPKIDFENLPEDGVGMSLSAIQAAAKTRQYIDGSYQAQYQFALIYRLQPEDGDSRLAADEALSKIGAWAERNEEKPALGAGMNVISVKRDSNAALLAVYDDGSQDHQILMTMLYEVNKYG